MLQELGTQNVPVQNPKSWSLGSWSGGLTLDTSSLYETSSVLSAHIETATLPVRHKRRPEDLADFCNHLNWSQSTKFSQLSGSLPYDGTSEDLGKVVKEFSVLGAANASVNVSVRLHALPLLLPRQSTAINIPCTFVQRTLILT